MNFLLFLLVISLLCKESLEIYGGCMSYSTKLSNIHKHVEVEIFFLNGWKLHKGPCYNCTESDEGHDVTARRKQYIHDHGNPKAFGSWGFEPAVKMGTANQNPITTDVNNNISDIVLMVNSHEQWEMESSKITMDIDLSTSFNGIFDITFESGPDVAIKKIPDMNIMFLQVKVDANVRTDTNKPNNSPIVLVKPYYSLELGKEYRLHIPVIDNDGDVIQCDLSNYLEAKGFTEFIRNLSSSNLLAVDNTVCILMLTIREPTFQVGDTFGIPVTLKDYGKEDTVEGIEKHHAYNTPIGRVTVLMYFNVTDITHPPKFVEPTPPNNQRYTIYVGGDFHVNVYAKPTQRDRFITKFNFLRRDGKPVNQTDHVSLLDPKIKYISMSWSPVSDDKGHHIICANAEDSAGVSTVELHCFRIEVKVNLFRPNQQIQVSDVAHGPLVTSRSVCLSGKKTLFKDVPKGKPYYASFPEPKDIVCPVQTFCRFPVYAATANTGDIVKEIVSTTESKENVTIEYSHDVIYGNQSTTVAQVEFFAEKIGVQQICLNASDSLAWTVQCLYVTVQRPDPCASVPCLHGGLCSPSEDNSGFQCYCFGRYRGQFCEIENGPCDMEKNLCVNSTCRPTPLPPLYICTECAPDKTGFHCDIDTDLCHPNNCHQNEICQQSGKDLNCLSAKPTDSCPMGCTLNASTVCVQNKCVCAMGMVKDGVCKRENSIPLDIEPHFVSPSPEIGSVITCDVNKWICHFPIYISSSSVPCASVFDNTFDSWVQSINFSTPQKDILSDVYQITVSMKKTADPVPHYKEFDLCLNVAKLSACLSTTDKRCFHVAIKAVPAVKDNEKQIPIQYPGCSFSLQTTQRDSIIGCKKGNPCHFYMYAETIGTCPSLITNDIHTGIYTPTLISGLCRYEIVYTNTSTSGRKTVCFMLCSKGESRCYQIFTNDMADHCSSNPCKNNAYCQTMPTGSVKCHCQKGYKGLYCEKGFCTNNPSCKNDAACLMNSNETECVCRPGFIGVSCSQNLIQASRDIVGYGGHFTMINRLEKLTCYINGQCTVPFSIINLKNTVPRTEVGYFDKTLKVQSIVLEETGSSGGLVNGILTVVGYEIGEKMMCLDSLATSNDRIEDEVCFKINVTEGHYMAPQKLFPYFVRPTLPDSSVLQCVVKDRCYLNLWAKNIVGMNKCPVLVPDKSIEDGVYVFPLKDVTRQPCVYDVSMLREDASQFKICFTLLSDKSENTAAYQDERCYFIRFQQNLTGQGPCIGISCYNNGFCDGSSSVPQCICRSGFSRDDCSKRIGIAQGITDHSGLQNGPLFGDFLLPELIKCPLSESCVIPYAVTNTNCSFGYNLSWTGLNISSVTLANSTRLGSFDCSGTATIVHNVTGTDELCLSLTSLDGSRRVLHDNVCCNVSSEPDNTGVSPYIFQSHFISPSPTNGSEFSCTPGQPCHVQFSTTSHYNQKCPGVRDISSSPVHIFNSLSDTVCQHDISILSEKNTTGSEEYCFQTTLSGITGETRCIRVYFKPHALPLITTTTGTSLSTILTTSESMNSLNALSTTDFISTPNPNIAQNVSKESDPTIIPMFKTDMTTVANTINAQNSNSESVSTTIPSSTTDMPMAAKYEITQKSNSESVSTTFSISTNNMPSAANSNNAQYITTEVVSTAVLSTTDIQMASTSKIDQNSVFNIVTTTIPVSPSVRSTQTPERTTYHCNIMKAKQKVARGRVECYCIYPDSGGVVTKVIALNPRVSFEKLLIAAGLGAGAMITTLGVAAFLFILTKGCRSSNKTGFAQNARKSRKISVQSLSGETDSAEKH